MDFRSILDAAQQNVSISKQKSNFYSTKFSAPKKDPKERKLSSNIKKFLEKQKQEEEEKQRMARLKKLEMIAKRDPKIQRKIDKTLKVLKSSKKFYTGDKELDENTEVTLENSFSLADNDDYGFESKTSEALHLKLMEKYKKLPPDNKFSSSAGNGKTKKSTTSNDEDIHFHNGQKVRVSKVASENGKKQSSSSSKSPKLPSSSSKSSKPSSSSTSTSVSSSSQSTQNTKSAEKPKLKPAPIVNFEELLKLAAQKQHEDIVIDVPVKKETERLMTSKERKEFEELEAARKAKLKRNGSSTIMRIPKLGPVSVQDKNNNDKDKKNLATKESSENKKVQSDVKSSVNAAEKKPLNGKSKPLESTQSPHLNSRDAPSSSQKSNQPNSFKVSPNTSVKSNIKPKDVSSKTLSNGAKVAPVTATNSKLQSSSSKEIVKTREFPPKDLAKTREFPPRDLVKTREFPPRDLVKTREFPPRDLVKTREFPPRDMKRPNSDFRKPSSQQMHKKRRIIDDDDDESEYDSELDDFIDDGDEGFNYSNEIQKIFGYDKSRFRDEDFDDREMESDYRTVMREEFISKKIGIMEDLEDMKMEAEEKKRKEMMKKKKKRS